MLFLPNPLMWAADRALRRLKTERKQTAACVLFGAATFCLLAFVGERQPLKVITMTTFGAVWGLAASVTLVASAAYKQRLMQLRGGRLGFGDLLRVGAIYSGLLLLAAISLSVLLL